MLTVRVAFGADATPTEAGSVPPRRPFVLDGAGPGCERVRYVDEVAAAPATSPATSPVQSIAPGEPSPAPTPAPVRARKPIPKIA